MVRYFEKRNEQLIELPERQTGCWINVSPPFNMVEIERLAEERCIPIDFLTDALDVDERARFDYDDDVRLIILNTPVISERGREGASYVTVPIGIILMPENVLTISSYDNIVLQAFSENKVRNFNPSDPCLFVLQLFERNVHAYLRFLKDINVKRNEIEQEIFETSRNEELRKLLSLEKSLVYFATALSTNALLMAKIQRMDFLGIKQDEEKSDLLEDLIIDNNQALEMANIYSNILGTTMEALASMISNTLNKVMQRLTIVTVILMFPTLLASFYGMNVDLPFAQHPYAFWFVLSSALTFGGLMIVFFHSKRML